MKGNEKVIETLNALLADEFGGTYGAQADTMAEVLYQDSFNATPGYFEPYEAGQNDGWDPNYGNTDYYWYNLGLTGLIDAFEYFQNTGKWWMPY